MNHLIYCETIKFNGNIIQIVIEFCNLSFRQTLLRPTFAAERNCIRLLILATKTKKWQKLDREMI